MRKAILKQAKTELPSEPFNCVTPASQRALSALEVLEKKSLWQPDL